MASVFYKEDGNEVEFRFGKRDGKQMLTVVYGGNFMGTFEVLAAASDSPFFLNSFKQIEYLTDEETKAMRKSWEKA